MYPMENPEPVEKVVCPMENPEPIPMETPMENPLPPPKTPQIKWACSITPKKTIHLFTDEGGKKTKLRPVCAILAIRDFISGT